MKTQADQAGPRALSDLSGDRAETQNLAGKLPDLVKELTGPWQQWAEPESLLEVQLKDNELHLHRSDNHHDGFLKAVRTRQDPVSDAEATHVASYPGLIAEIAARLETKLSKPAPQECVSPAGTGPPK